MDGDNLLENPKKFKEFGDSERKIGNIDSAINYYNKSIISLRDLFEKEILSEEASAQYITEIGIPTHLNMSWCFMKKEDWENVIFYTNKILELEPKNTKALYRRCIAYLNSNKLNDANFDFELLQNLIKGTKELEELEKMFSTRISMSDKSEMETYRKMMKKYFQLKEQKECRSLKNRCKDIAIKLPCAIKSLFYFVLDKTVMLPINLGLKTVSTAKHVMIDMPVSFAYNTTRSILSFGLKTLKLN